MKKNLLLLLSIVLLSTGVFAQKNKIYKDFLDKYKPKMTALSEERGAAYLIDSSNVYFHEMGDSTLFVKLKYTYNANGTVKTDDSFIDFLGIFQVYQKNNYFYKAAKPLLLNYKEIIVSEDGILFEKYALDSSFYDAKDRVTLQRVRLIEDKSIASYTTNKYKTNFDTPDTTRVFNVNDATGDLEITNATFNTLDAKGNIISIVTSGIDAQTEEFGLSEKYDFTLNAQNLATKQLVFSWDSDTKSWIPNASINNTFNADATLKSAVTLSEYEEFDKVFLAKDSIFYLYNKGALAETKNYTYDADEKIYLYIGYDLYKNDSKGNLVRTESYTGTDTDPLDLQLFISQNSWYSFYKDAVATKDLFSKDFELITANPMNENQEITVKTKLDGEYILLAFDSNGKIVNRTNISSNQALRTQLPTAGTYIFILTDANNAPLAMKKVTKM